MMKNHTKIIKSALASLATLLLTSCTAETPAQSYINQHQCAPCPDSAYIVSDDTSAVCVYDNKIYTAGTEIGFYDLENDGAYTKLYDIGKGTTAVERYEHDYSRFGGGIVVNLIDAKIAFNINEYGIYYMNDAMILQLSHDGSVQREFDIPTMEGYDTSWYSIYGTDEYLYVFLDQCITVNNRIQYYEYIYVFDKNSLINSIDISKIDDFDTNMIFDIIESENEIIFAANGALSGGSGSDLITRNFKLNAQTGEVTKICELRDGDFELFNRLVNGSTAYGCRLSDVDTYGICDLETGDFTTLRNISDSYKYNLIKREALKKGREPGIMGIQHICFTGYNYVEWDYGNNVVLFLTEKPENVDQSLTVLAPIRGSNAAYTAYGQMSKDMLKADVQFEEENGVVVKQIGIDAATFNEKLRLKLLAGENDYDVVLLEDAPELLAQILNYQLYLPLENYKKITSGFKNYIDGIEGLMTSDGHLYGIPYQVTGSCMTVDNAFFKKNLTLPEADYTIDDFWNLCKEAADSNVGLINERDIFIIMMSAIVEEGVHSKNMNKDTIKTFIEKWNEARKGGAVNGEYRSINLMAQDNATNFANDAELSMKNDVGRKFTNYYTNLADCIGFPTYDGKRYYAVKSMLFANAKTQNPDLAAEYLALQVSEDYVSSVRRISKSFLAKDPMAYFTYKLGNVESEYELIKEPFTLDIYSTMTVKNGDKIFTNAAPQLYTHELEEAGFFDEIAKSLIDGTMTAEEAAEKIFTEAKYKIME